MNVLYVYAHPEAKSLNSQLMQSAFDALAGGGHEVMQSDLHAMSFTAVHGRIDFETVGDADVFRYGAEQQHATRKNGFAADIQAEIDKLYACDMLILQFPLWWFSVPAILKGWFDRVFAAGVVYDGDNRYGNGRLKGRRAMCVITMGARESAFMADGRHGDLLVNLWPIHNGCLHYLGFDVLPPFVLYRTSYLSDAERRQYVNEYSDYLQNIDTLKPLYFHPDDDFDVDGRLRPGIDGGTRAQRRLR